MIHTPEVLIAPPVDLPSDPIRAFHCGIEMALQLIAQGAFTRYETTTGKFDPTDQLRELRGLVQAAVICWRQSPAALDTALYRLALYLTRLPRRRAPQPAPLPHPANIVPFVRKGTRKDTRS